MIEEKIVDLIKNELNISEFGMEENLVEEFEVDSISLLDFFMIIEEEFEIEFEDEELEKLKSAQDIVDLVESKLE